MVTLYYLRRHLAFLMELFGPFAECEASVSEEVSRLLSAVHAVLRKHQHMLRGKISDAQRKLVLDKLGRAGSLYRAHLYQRGLSGRKDKLRGNALLSFFRQADRK